MVLVPKAHKHARAMVASNHPSLLESFVFRHAAVHATKGAAVEQEALKSTPTGAKHGMALDLFSPRGPKDLFAEDLFENWVPSDLAFELGKPLTSLTSSTLSRARSTRTTGQCWPLIHRSMSTKTEVERFHASLPPHAKLIVLPDRNSTVSNPSTRASDPSWLHQPSKRARSRAIPIKRGRSLARTSSHESQDEHNDPACSDDESEMERMYDWSTWRLYHRILEHREKHPLTASYYSDAAEHSSQSAAEPSSGRSTSRGRAVTPSRASHVHFEKSPLEGEVFELEL